MEANDMVTVGRCANNLGIIANMQGDYGRAIGAYTRALAAYEQGQYAQGIAEAQHNLGISYREEGRLDDALQAADAAVRAAEQLGDRQLKARALAGRAEIRVVRREPALAIREAEAALAIHRELGDPARQAESQRILAVALGVMGKVEEAESMLRDVIAGAAPREQPLLLACAQRDLAYLMARRGGGASAAIKDLIRQARAAFDRLGADREIERLDTLLGDLE